MAASTATLEAFYRDPDSLPQPRRRFDDLIGRKSVVDMLKGTLPYFAGDAHLNFPELALTVRPGTYTKSAAFLFLSDPGNGRHTMDEAYCHYLRETFEDQLDDGDELSDYFRCYRVDPEALIEESGTKTNENISALFDSIVESFKKDEDTVLRYLSFGDLSGLFRKRKSVRLFARRLEELLADENVFCIVTAACDIDPSEIPSAVLRAFVPFWLAPPTDYQRQQFFAALKEKYRFIHWELTPDAMAERTKGFSFRMLQNAATYLLLRVKGDMLEQDLKLEQYLPYAQPGVKPVLLSETEIADAIEMARHTAVTARRAAAIPAAQLAFLGANQVVQTAAPVAYAQPSSEGAHAEKKANDEKEVTVPETISGLQTLISEGLVRIPSVMDKKKAAATRKQASEAEARQPEPQPRPQPAPQPAPQPRQEEEQPMFGQN
ncbi:MAG: hypothetical protein IK104_04080 [Clostridia bacterium]|nr:hypothetical protein [Clostridia bacterium]